MSLEKIRAQLNANVWQAIAQSGVDLSSVPHDQQEQMVRKITENVMMAMDSALDEVPTPEAEVETDQHSEPVLWQGRPFLSLNESYVLTSERIKIIKGLLSRDIENFELIRIQDVDYSQGVGERLAGVGDITIRGHDASDAVVVLRNVKDPENVYETLRKAWLDARKRHGLQFREYM